LISALRDLKALFSSEATRHGMNESKAPPPTLCHFGPDGGHSPLQSRPFAVGAQDFSEMNDGNDKDGEKVALDQLAEVVVYLNEPGRVGTSSDDVWADRGPDPTVQVDYLSHGWEEGDIWWSWRYVRRQRENCSKDATRLENATWRTWAKCRSGLEMVSPENLNWHDARNALF
jgi:hypothetical protein